jgi:hypothetical protein
MVRRIPEQRIIGTINGLDVINALGWRYFALSPAMQTQRIVPLELLRIALPPVAVTTFRRAGAHLVIRALLDMLVLLTPTTHDSDRSAPRKGAGTRRHERHMNRKRADPAGELNQP